MGSILNKSVLDSKDYNDPGSVLYRGVLDSTKNNSNQEANKEFTNIEIDFFNQISLLNFDNPYDYLKKILEKLTNVKFPELPIDTRLIGDWDRMYNCWFFETIENFPNATWLNNSKTTFNSNSEYCIDIANSISFNDISNDVCIKNKFFKIADSKRANPFKGTFNFIGKDSGKKNYYSWVEWYLGSYTDTINWKKTALNKYEIKAKITNTSSWHSATRLPKSWQDKLKKEIGLEIKNLVDSAPRGETVRRKLNPIILKTLEFFGVFIPSFGGNWSQEYNIETQW